MERRTEQAKASAESAISEKQASKSNTNDIAVIYEKSNPSNLKMVTYAKPSTVKAMALSKSSIKDVQTKLNAIGYSCGTPDGIAGKNTKAAVTSFQKLCGLKNQSGDITSETITKLNSVYNRSQKGVLSRGLRNNASVKKLQENLNKLNFNCGTPDGTFGAGTEKAVIAFQKAHGLSTDGIVGNNTQSAINKALKNVSGGTSSQNTVSIQRMLDNLKNDKSLGLSTEKKAAMLKAAERLLNENYEVEFVAGVLGNIQNEGTPGKFESSNYKSNPSAKPPYLEYMDEHFDYRNKFSGKSIKDVGISAALELAKNAKASGYEGKFGLGMIQWTGSRTLGLLESYQKYASSDKPTSEECIDAEVNFMLDELQGDYVQVYNTWKKGDKTASSAGEIVCREYEKPKEMDAQSKSRAKNATKIYNVLTQ